MSHVPEYPRGSIYVYDIRSFEILGIIPGGFKGFQVTFSEFMSAWAPPLSPMSLHVKIVTVGG